MRRPLAVLVILLGLVLMPGAALAGPAGAQDFTVKFDPKGAQFHYRICLKSDTSIKEKNGEHWDRSCTGRRDGITAQKDQPFSLTVKKAPEDRVMVDLEQFTFIGDNSVTKDNIDIMDGTECTFKGLASNGDFKCNWTDTPLKYKAPTIEAYQPDLANSGSPVMSLINLLAWCVSAAAVAGLIMTGTTMAMQLKRGITGEAAHEYVRPLSIIAAACMLAAGAGPLIQFFGFGT